MERRVERILSRQPTLEGAGVRLKRVFGSYEVPAMDPFLLLDHFGSNNPMITSKDFLGTLTEESKQLLTCGTAKSSTVTALATAA